MKNITQAIIAVMKAIKSIDKNLTVGKGESAYKGVSDKDVKQQIGQAMAENGLCIIPIGIEAKTQIDRWEESTQYGVKQKQQVLSEVVTKYLLLHESGESLELAGYGHGVDTQDKSAGKATTYALKYTLLYLFMVPTGKIDDADNDHSDEKEIPEKKAIDNRQWLNQNTEEWKKAVEFLQTKDGSIVKIETKYRLSKENKTALIEQAQEVLATA